MKIKTSVPVPTLRRFPSYLRFLQAQLAKGRKAISSGELSANISSDSILIRKDLSNTKILGVPRKGFCITDLIRNISNLSGFDNPRRAALFGAGYLGTALLHFKNLKSEGVDIVAIFDTDKQKIGTAINGIEIKDAATAKETLPSLDCDIVIIAAPESEAQNITDIASYAKVPAVLNFAEFSVHPSGDTIVQNADLSAPLSVLGNRLRLRDMNISKQEA